ncbi:MAG: hypothetical protein WD426_16720 [Anditalea sp.]
MATSPQWYFAYIPEENKIDEVKLNFKEGNLEEIVINQYNKTYNPDVD